MTPKRKLRSFLVPLEQVALAMKVATTPERPLPADALPVSGHWDADHCAMRITFYSEAFDEVPPGVSVPPSENGPTILEAPK